jgi:hypothetical protein
MMDVICMGLPFECCTMFDHDQIGLSDPNLSTAWVDCGNLLLK